VIYYKEYLLSRNQYLSQFLNSVDNNTGAITPGTGIQDDSISQSQSLSAMHTTRDEKHHNLSLKQIKASIQSYVLSQDISLNTLFKVLDTDSDKRLELNEFKNKLGALGLKLDDADQTLLFNSLDKNKNGSITYQEFCQEFSGLSVQILLTKIRKMIEGVSTAPQLFQKHCSDKQN
jgi:hypothetical protein